MNGERGGVLQRERDRAARWVAAGLPDPIGVIGEERLTRAVSGPSEFTPPRRAAHPQLREKDTEPER